MQTDDNFRLIGMDIRTEWQSLRCGALTVYFDPALGALRNIRLGDREVVRAIYVAVRDHNCGTVQPSLGNLKLDIDPEAAPDSFCLTFTAECREREVHFLWRGEIVGHVVRGES